MLSLIFILVVIIHFIAQFALWAHLPGNHSKGSDNFIYEGGWSILSFPIFYMLPENVLNSYFWTSMSVNSLLWSTLICATIKTIFLR